ncbi:hypothetical protein M885DRAFT_522956, partial [Pelagophyceae sp. CCMP2097]
MQAPWSTSAAPAKGLTWRWPSTTRTSRPLKASTSAALSCASMDSRWRPGAATSANSSLRSRKLLKTSFLRRGIDVTALAVVLGEWVRKDVQYDEMIVQLLNMRPQHAHVYPNRKRNRRGYAPRQARAEHAALLDAQGRRRFSAVVHGRAHATFATFRVTALRTRAAPTSAAREPAPTPRTREPSFRTATGPRAPTTRAQQ